MKQLNEMERRAYDKDLHPQDSIRGFAYAFWPCLAFWLAFALFVCAAWPAHAKGYRVPEFYEGCKVPAGVTVIHVEKNLVNAVCRNLGVNTVYSMGACYSHASVIVVPFRNQVGAGWYNELMVHEIAHSMGWAGNHPRLKNLKHERACK